jgi:hypothetical protein
MPCQVCCPRYLTRSDRSQSLVSIAIVDLRPTNRVTRIRLGVSLCVPDWHDDDISGIRF